MTLMTKGEKIDLDRGVELRRHSTGMEVYMYIDQPGVYYTVHGTELPKEIAKAAGFPVETLEKAREKALRVAEAHAAIDAQFSADMGINEVVRGKENDWRVVHTGNERHDVYDPDGNKLNPAPLPAKLAFSLFDQIASPEALAASGVARKEADIEEDKREKKDVGKTSSSTVKR